MSHIAVERNRRKQMNEHLKVLRSLTPCFYIKRGDQASIIAGAIEFVKELHQLLETLESKKKRKSLSPSTPGPSPASTGFRLLPADLEYSDVIINSRDQLQGMMENPVKELGAFSNSPFADVEANISGYNVILKTISKRIPGQIVKIIQVFEGLGLEITHLNISSTDDTVLYCFVLKIGLECTISVEELVLEVQKSFSLDLFLE